MSNLNLNFNTFEIPNGIKSFLFQTDRVHSVAIYIVLESGSLDEEGEESGALHFLEHLAFDGTRDLPTWKDVNNFHNDIAGSGNASTGYKETSYYGVYPAQYIEKALYYYSQIILKPSHTDESIEKERTIIIDEMKRYEDMVEEKVFDLVVNSRFLSNDTPFSRKIIGSEANLKNFTGDMLRGIFQKYYSPKKIKIFIAGNFDELDVENYIKKYFYDELDHEIFSSGVENIYATDFPDYSGIGVFADQKSDTEQIYLNVNFPSLDMKSYTQEERIIESLMSQILSSSKYQNSILWSKLREELGLVYDVSVGDLDMFSRCIVSIDTAFTPEYISVVLGEIFKGIERLKRGEFDDGLLKVIVKNKLDTSLIKMDNMFNVVSWMVSYQEEIDAHEVSMDYQEYLEFLKSIQKKDIINKANQIFDYSKLNVCLVSKFDKLQMTESVMKFLSEQKIV